MQQGRQQIVDAIRGLSLLGILIANMAVFQYGTAGSQLLESFDISSFDMGVQSLLEVVIIASFMPIFMFLMGYGLSAMSISMTAKGRNFYTAMIRRFSLLIILGAAHIVFLWEGDILLMYGIAAFLLLLFLERKAKTVLVWFIISFVLLVLSNAGGNADSGWVEGLLMQYADIANNVYANGSYFEVIGLRLNEAPMFGPVIYRIITTLSIFIYLPMFLLGIYASKKQWFQQVENKRKTFLLTSFPLILVGLGMKSIKVISPDAVHGEGLYIVGGNVLAVGYILLFTWMLSLTKMEWLSNRFAAVGKLSLTNYLMQSVVCTTIFYGYGLGWFSEIGILLGLLLAIAIYTVQLFTSHWYLKRFRVGPVEWLLRAWTYLSWSGSSKAASKKDTVTM
ncbi:DUF418 domain-containing protein [Paenibacillus sp. GSMTC-2017]|uniref:DUF418 domain-containing protein n=1 Tax=Paenibacillus sp. GSMTC-2017 TaxID=2794350 RepID=UPI0018D7EF71|nr:DUF418 domain-containing protein [Paenibacillus sp. GSMTC-2017]MBH5318975.1 DUF418 domain-containing protein [Paenibacillus sp. GSMTC-2017]